ncbi:MAG TPA: hypothetical protein VEQ10_20495, partial [Vicinamibacteria bacterium]|nr:hypothetical protein [Vicinamibacteria bacterium]
EVRRKAEPQLDRLPRRQVRSVEELKRIPDVLEGVSDVVGAEMDAFLDAKMTPREYRWVERVVYEHWRGALRRAGTYPVATRQAAAEIKAASLAEKDARVRARLQSLAEEMKRRVPPAPEGVDAETHALLLARLSEIERWSMDDLGGARIPVPQ